VTLNSSGITGTGYSINSSGIVMTGGSINVNDAFTVSTLGAVVASNLTISGGSIAIASAWHVDASGNMWWGNYASYALASIKISAAGSITMTSGTFSGSITGATGTFSGTVTVGGTALTSANTTNTSAENFPLNTALELHIPCVHKQGSTSTGSGNGSAKLDKFGVYADDITLGTPGVDDISITIQRTGLTPTSGIDGTPNSAIRVEGASTNTKMLTIGNTDDLGTYAKFRYGVAIGLSFWVRIVNINAGNRALCCGQWLGEWPNMGYYGFSCLQWTGNDLKMWGETNTNGDDFDFALGNQGGHDSSKWHHIVLTQGSDNEIHVYCNGVNTDNETPASAWTVNCFGTGYVDLNGPLNTTYRGCTDFAEIRYYDIELSADQVKSLYENPYGIQGNPAAENAIAGWTLDDTAIYSGTKASSGAFSTSGGITLGSTGYLSGPAFWIDTSGNALFKGTIDMANATMGSTAGSGASSGARGKFEDFFEVPSGKSYIQAKSTATLGGTALSGWGSAIVTASAGEGGVTCVLRGTKILTKRGEINIEDTKEDDIIRVYDWKKKEWGWSSIDKILNRETKEGWSHIKTEKGYELKCSNSHLLYHPDYPGHAIKTDELGEGGQLYVVENGEIIEDIISTIEVHNEPIEVWNYELKFTHNYISNGILSHNALGKTTLPHKHIKRNDVDIETGDLVKLDENNELIKVTQANDSSVVGILWYKVIDVEWEHEDVTAIKKIAKYEEPDPELFYRDSLGNTISENEREEKSIWAVAAIGDTRNYSTLDAFQLDGMKVCNQNGEVKKGDLVCSSDVLGYLMKQPMEYVILSFEDGNPIYEERQTQCSYTVGKCMEDVEFDEDGKAESIYGYLSCG
jgi:hypothetical protein